ncbi:solute carrier family 23 protein, partial [Ruminobacter sp.]|uniref:solute carrier family 23 protein n=1 Tax=Ruminobacter sp. TaxID=2774296 RepID=UPI0038635D40
GMMLIYIGFGSNVSIYAEGNGYSEPFYVMRDFFGAMTPTFLKAEMGREYSQMIISVITIFLGLFVIVHFHKRRNSAAVILGILTASVFYWLSDYFILGRNPFRDAEKMSFLPDFGNMYRETLFNFDFSTFMNIGTYTVIMVLITFCIIDMFGTIGSLVGLAANAGMLDRDGKLPKIKQALLSDAVATVTGACTGSSTVVTFAESASGIQVGGRTGLTSFTTACLFALCIFISPLVAAIPPAATSTALIYIGVVMMQGLGKIDFRDIEQVTPVFIMMLAIAVSGSVGNGIGLGLVCYTIIKLIAGKYREVTPLTYGVTVIFLIKFFVAV